MSVQQVTASSNWEECRPLLEDTLEFRAFSEESSGKKAKKGKDKDKEKERERRKDKDKDKDKERDKDKEKSKREKETIQDGCETGNNHVHKEEKKREKDKDREKDKKHKKRHRSSSEDAGSDREDSKGPRRMGLTTRSHLGSIYEQHGHESGSDSEARHKRHRRDRDGTRRNGAGEELEDEELGEDGEIR
ncbi:hypothetical protein R1flu_023691 [Riccia fluitans]|uniref:Uncharacterized protein n=1 Tax=Riccia fluitans TaxID=41844 RepID=A0ABD1XT93_9MARC